MSATTLNTRAVQPDAWQTIPSPLTPSDGRTNCHKDVGLEQIAQTARSNATTCLDLADRLFRQGDRDAADALLKLAQECQSIAQRAATL